MGLTIFNVWTIRFPQWESIPLFPPDPRLYRVSFLQAGSLGECPVKGCGGQALTCTNLRIPVVRHHMQEMIVIMEEVNHPHPHCLAFDMFVSWAEINHHHPIISLCLRGSNRKRQ